MGRKSSLRRPVATRKVKRTIRVFTEGQVTEPAYVKGLKQLDHVRYNTSVRIEIARDHGDPYLLVAAAVDAVADDDVDEAWCLVDVEAPKAHPRLVQAQALADKHDNVHLVVSNPCFEVWIVLHHQDLGKHLSTDDACRLANRQPGVTGKHIDVAVLIPLREGAARRAQALAKIHEREERHFPDDNPSTGMGAFVAALEGPAVL